MIKTNEPVAWAVTPRGNNEEIDCEFIYPDPAIAGDVALGALDGESDAVVVPLYRHPQPTLTDDEREFLQALHAAYEEMANQTGSVNAAVQADSRKNAAIIRGLLKRLGGCK